MLEEIKMIIKRKSIDIGMNGIDIFDGFEKYFLSWKEIVGINGNKKRGEIYTKKGKIIKFNYKFFHTLDYKIIDYEKNQIGEGTPTEIKDWQTAFIRIKTYIKERGGTYVEELEGLYNSWWSLMQFGDLRNLKYSIEEIKEKKIIKIVISICFLYWFFLFVWGAVFGNKIKNELIGFSIVVFGVLLWTFIMFMVFFTKRPSKLKKILKRNQIVVGENDEEN